MPESEDRQCMPESEDRQCTQANNERNELSRLQNDKPKKQQEVVVENESPKAQERIIHTSIGLQKSSVPFPHRLRKEKEEAHQQKFLENLKQLHINILFIEALVQMSKYARYLNDLLTNKSKLEEACTITMNERCSTVLLRKLPSKEKDPGSFTIPCQISNLHINNALADLGASDDEVVFDMEQSMKNPSAEDDECYSIANLDETINEETQSIQRVNTAYSDGQGNKGVKNISNEHLYSASANKIDEKKPKLKDLPSHLEYAYLHNNESFPVIISSKLSKKEKRLLLQVLEKHKGAIAWKMSDIKGISPSFYIHKILMEDNFKPVIQPQRRLNPKVQDISIAPEDQEKTSFTCPYGTFSHRRMSFGLCNAPSTFQRCMTAIIHDMVEDFMEVFMDDFSVFGNSFNSYLTNLDKMLA
ncbi:hypothetical protein Tco_0451102 [Tanacetum coccineum]